MRKHKIIPTLLPAIAHIDLAFYHVLVPIDVVMYMDTLEAGEIYKC